MNIEEKIIIEIHGFDRSIVETIRLRVVEVLEYFQQEDVAELKNCENGTTTKSVKSQILLLIPKDVYRKKEIKHMHDELFKHVKAVVPDVKVETQQYEVRT